jgi:lipid-A-disaccharide synthase
MELTAHMRDTAVMGFTEVLGSLGKILRVRRALKDALKRERPAAAVLIDSPDLNFGLAKYCRKLKIPVVYYICPQVWAWRAGRLNFLREFASRRCLIFPFEKRWFSDRGVGADFCGHPLFDEITPEPKEALRERLGIKGGGPVLAVLPGSRPGIFRRLAPAVFGAVGLLAKSVPGLEPLAALSPLISEDECRSALAPFPEAERAVRILRGRSRELLGAADAALLASGTSVMEAAVIGTPMAAAYKVSPLSWLIARLLVRAPSASAANLAAGKPIMRELLQDGCTPESLARAMEPLLSDTPERRLQLYELGKVRKSLGGPGASRKVLEIIAQVTGEAERDPQEPTGTRES